MIRPGGFWGVVGSLKDSTVGDITAGGLGLTDNLHDITTLQPVILCNRVSGLHTGQLGQLQLVVGQQLLHLLGGQRHVLGDQDVLGDVDNQFTEFKELDLVLGGLVICMHLVAEHCRNFLNGEGGDDDGGGRTLIIHLGGEGLELIIGELGACIFVGAKVNELLLIRFVHLGDNKTQGDEEVFALMVGEVAVVGAEVIISLFSQCIRDNVLAVIEELVEGLADTEEA